MTGFFRAAQQFVRVREPVRYADPERFPGGSRARAQTSRNSIRHLISCLAGFFQACIPIA
jgi:hypothetical protein